MTNHSTVAFIAGVFDLTHQGHFHILREARKLADYLVVAINDDNYIRTVKHREPIYSLNRRIAEIAATGLADKIVTFHSDPLPLILRFRPDFIVVGDDYTEDRVVGAKECREWDGKVVIIPRLPGLSTTEIIRGRNGKTEVWENGRKIGAQG